MEQGIGIKAGTEYVDGNRPHSAADVLQDILVMAMLTAGAAGQFLQWTSIRGIEYIHMWGMLTVAVIATVVLGYAVRSSVFSYMTAPLIAIITTLLHGPASLFYGFFGVINYMIGWWNISHEDAVTMVMQEQISADDVRGCVMVLALIMIPAWWNIVRHRRIFVGMIIILCCMIPGLVVGSVSVAACGAYLAGWFGLLLVRGELAFGIRGVVWQLAVGVLCIGTAMLSGSERVDAVARFKENADTAVEHIRYGYDTLPEGDLSKSGQMLAGDEPTLTVQTEQQKNIYLGGFVGSYYKDGKWQDLPSARYRGENDGMLEWLSDRHFLVQDQYAVYDTAGSSGQKQGNRITVKNVGANRKYVYIPYSADIPSGTKVSVNQDTNLLAFGLFGASSYEYNDWSSDRPGELLYAENWVGSPATDEENQYVDAEKVYSDFVYNNYLDVDAGMAAVVDKVFSGDLTGAADSAGDTNGDAGSAEDSEGTDGTASGWADAETIYAVTNQIRGVLNTRTNYAAASDIPEDVDPIEWFLAGGGQGNSALYASAAVMAFRCKGIPARYAEGYLLPGDKNLAGAADEQVSIDGVYTYTLTNQNSHAWAEVYLDGVGWIPVDVTPGFYYDTYTLLQMVKKPQNINESAANDDSSNIGNQIDEDREQDTSGRKNDDEKKPLVISLDILAVILILAVLVFICLELRYFVRRMTVSKRYERLDDISKTAALNTVIFRLLKLYGCDAGPGWNAEKTDAILAAGLFERSGGNAETGKTVQNGGTAENAETVQSGETEENAETVQSGGTAENGRKSGGDSRQRSAVRFYEGEYLRIAAIIEKNIYGEQELTAGEQRTLYIFAEKLYDAGKAAGLKVRLKLRYGMV